MWLNTLLDINASTSTCRLLPPPGMNIGYGSCMYGALPNDMVSTGENIAVSQRARAREHLDCCTHTLCALPVATHAVPRRTPCSS